MRKIVPLLAALFFASLCWGQYTTNYQFGLSDISIYCASTHGTNCWFALPGNGVCKANTLSYGQDGTLMCIGTDNYAYSFSGDTLTWTKNSAMGASSTKLAVEDSTNIWSLQTTSYCTSQGNGSGIFFWNGTAWTQPSSTSCLSQLSVGSDGTLGGVTLKNYAYISTNGGVSWSKVGTGNGWTQLSVADNGDWCGVENGELWMEGGGTSPFAFTPSPGTIVGCASAPAADSGDTALLVWDSSGAAQTYNFDTSHDLTAGTWTGIAGLGAKQIVTQDLGNTLALDASGIPYHYNVYAPYLQGNTTGTWNNCPIDGCPSGAEHQVTLDVEFPNSLTSNPANANFGAATYVNAQATTTAHPGTCDFFFGNPQSAGCTPKVPTGKALCLVSLATLATPGPVPKLLNSVYYHSWDATRTTYATPIIGGFVGTAECGASINACQPPTKPVCGQGPVYYPTETFDAFMMGPNADPNIAQGIAAKKCVTGNPPRAWKVFSQYESGAPLTCTPKKFKGPRSFAKGGPCS
jgi:hypothetical protein